MFLVLDVANGKILVWDASVLGLIFGTISNSY